MRRFMLSRLSRSRTRDLEDELPRGARGVLENQRDDRPDSGQWRGTPINQHHRRAAFPGFNVHKPHNQHWDEYNYTSISPADGCNDSRTLQITQRWTEGTTMDVLCSVSCYLSCRNYTQRIQGRKSRCLHSPPIDWREHFLSVITRISVLCHDHIRPCLTTDGSVVSVVLGWDPACKKVPWQTLHALPASLTRLSNLCPHTQYT